MSQVREVHIPSLHRGQIAVVEGASKYNVVRSGRRWGKTTLGQERAGDTMLPAVAGKVDRRVGWFSPNYPLFLEAWDRLVQMFGPIAVYCNKGEKRILLLNGALLEAWSLDTDDPGRGRYYHRIIIDEAGLVPNLMLAWNGPIRATIAQTQGDAWFLGTGKVTSEDFNALFARGLRGDDKLWRSFRAASTDNTVYDPGTGRTVGENMAIEIEQARKEGVPEWLIQLEYFGGEAGSDAAFFRAETIETQQRLYAAPPLRRGSLDIPALLYADRDRSLIERKVFEIRWTDDEAGPWRLWVDRPDHNRVYAMGVDVAQGVGATNTVFSVGDVESGRKVARYSYPGVTPSQAARLAMLAGYWFAGVHGAAAICVERTGPGEEFIGSLRDLGYPNIVQDRVPPSVGISNVDRLGWANVGRAKEAMLGEYRAALESRLFINPDAVALSQCLTFLFVRGRLTSLHERTDPSEDPAKVKHGDEVIADGLLWMAMRYAARLPRPAIVPREGSLAHREQARAKEERERKEQWAEW